jgi:hypothetical protein
MLLMLLPVIAQAKHVAPPAVPAITNSGVRYVVPNDKGLKAYVEAWSVSTGQKLWTKTIFTHWYIPPFGTECMHYEWIKSMALEKDDLLLTSERGRVYKLSIHTRSVRRAKKAPNPAVQATAAAHFVFSGWGDSQVPGFVVAQSPAAVPDLFRSA